VRLSHIVTALIKALATGQGPLELFDASGGNVGADGAGASVGAGWAAVTGVSAGSVAMVGRYADTMGTVTGCDALLTPTPGLVLLTRTADCLPIFFADPSRGVIGIAHAGWRGLAAALPARVVAAFRHAYHSTVGALHVAVGPAIRACCYEVGPEFVEWFEPFVQDRGGRRTCDLVGAARAQLAQCGIRPDRILDSQRCTACEAQHWYSLRRDGPTTGRLTSFIMLRP